MVRSAFEPGPCSCWWQVFRSQFSLNEWVWYFDTTVRIISNVWTGAHLREGTKLMDRFYFLNYQVAGICLVLLNRLFWAVMCMGRLWTKCCMSCKQWPLRSHINTVSSSLALDNQVPQYCSTGFWSHHCYKPRARFEVGISFFIDKYAVSV